jgi:hypothetical protein
MTIWSRLTCMLAIVGVASAPPARADWFTKLLAVNAVAALIHFSKNQLLLHLQARSTTAITNVEHDQPCDDRRRDFDAILPLATEAALLASTAYADPQAYGPGVSRIEPTAPARGPLGVYATTADHSPRRAAARRVPRARGLGPVPEPLL